MLKTALQWFLGVGFFFAAGIFIGFSLFKSDLSSLQFSNTRGSECVLKFDVEADTFSLKGDIHIEVGVRNDIRVPSQLNLAGKRIPAWFVGYGCASHDASELPNFFLESTADAPVLQMPRMRDVRVHLNGSFAVSNPLAILPCAQPPGVPPADPVQVLKWQCEKGAIMIGLNSGNVPEFSVGGSSADAGFRFHRFPVACRIDSTDDYLFTF